MGVMPPGLTNFDGEHCRNVKTHFVVSRTPRADNSHFNPSSPGEVGAPVVIVTGGELAVFEWAAPKLRSNTAARREAC